MTQYLVVKVTPCPCGGRPYQQTILNGDNEVVCTVGENCPDCNGTGVRREEVLLEEALAELGAKIIAPDKDVWPTRAALLGARCICCGFLNGEPDAVPNPDCPIHGSLPPGTH